VNKRVLLFLSCLLLVSVTGCGSSSTTTPAPNGFLYAANSFRPGSMSGVTVTTGALIQITGTPFVTTGNAPYTIAASPPALPSPAPAATAKFLYAGIPATTKGGVITRVLGRTLSGAVTGGIMMMPIKSDHTLDVPQMVASGGDYDPIAVTPSGNFLYAIDLTNNRLAAFSIDSTKGTLTAIGPQGPPVGLQVGPDPFSVVVDPQGKFVFVANCDCRTNPQNLGSVSVFAINTDGTLQALANSPFHLGVAAASARPIAMVVSPDSKFLFVASLAETPGAADEVYVESITNGALTDAVPLMPSVPLPVGSTPVSIAVSIDGGNSVYTGNAGTGTVSFFINCMQTPLPTVATTSVPCPTSSGNVLAPVVFQNNSSVGGTVGVVVSDPSSIKATTSGSTTTSAIAPGHFLYVTDYDHGTILALAVTSTTTCTTTSMTTSCATTPGTLTQSGSAVNTGGANPFGLAFAY
jgi:DNA-binding beta-propeller fold protein YncE